MSKKIVDFQEKVLKALAGRIDDFYLVGIIKPTKGINDIQIISLEDIYVKKIYTITGASTVEDSAGRKITRGNREEAKDFFDLYCLSHIFMRLSEFSFRYGSPVIREGIVRWFRTYNRFEMKTGLLELELKKASDYNGMERHFKKEIAGIIEREVGLE